MTGVTCVVAFRAMHGFARQRRTRTVFLLVALLCSSLATAEVTRDQPLVEDSGHTLNKGEWKLGITTSSYGITDRLQLDSALLLDLVILNAGLKYKLVDAPNLALSASAFAGGSAILLALKVGLAFGGVRLDASMPLTETISLNLAGSWQAWLVSAVGDTESPLLRSGRLSWFHARAGLQWVYTPRHIFFLSLATPTSWVAALGRGSNDFDATDFWAAMVGYQLSAGIVNVRLDLGYGPSLLGRGPTAALDFYVRF